MKKLFIVFIVFSGFVSGFVCAEEFTQADRDAIKEAAAAAKKASPGSIAEAVKMAEADKANWVPKDSRRSAVEKMKVELLQKHAEYEKAIPMQISEDLDVRRMENPNRPVSAFPKGMVNLVENDPKLTEYINIRAAEQVEALTAKLPGNLKLLAKDLSERQENGVPFMRDAKAPIFKTETLTTLEDFNKVGAMLKRDAERIRKWPVQGDFTAADSAKLGKVFQLDIRVNDGTPKGSKVSFYGNALQIQQQMQASGIILDATKIAEAQITSTSYLQAKVAFDNLNAKNGRLVKIFNAAGIEPKFTQFEERLIVNNKLKNPTFKTPMKIGSLFKAGAKTTAIGAIFGLAAGAAMANGSSAEADVVNAERSASPTVAAPIIKKSAPAGTSQ
jgi:hypothetical protein